MGIWVQWQDGHVECVDSADSDSEAAYLIQEYTTAFGGAVVRVWSQIGTE